MSEARNVVQKTLMSQYCKYSDFLDSSTHATLLEWAIENEAKFKPTTLYGDKYDPSKRMSLNVRDFGPMMPVLRQHVLDLVPALIRDLRVTPFEPSAIELEMVASNDGAIFKRHTDTFTGDQRDGSDRLLSAVYYFHTEPKAFSGGALRFYPFPFVAEDSDSNFDDVQPEQNTLVAFPSWALHEVLPVSCPSRRFSDSRFSVNCWALRNITAQAGSVPDE